MKDLYRQFGHDEQRIIQAYAAAERAGEVERESNQLDLTPEEYAKRLLYDGLDKGWINE